MKEKMIFRPPPEPAHVSLVRQYEELVAILQFIRTQAQEAVDQGFDQVSSKIGFVVATTLPVTAEVGKDSKIVDLKVRGKHLEGTLFEEVLVPAVKEKIKGKQIATKGAALSSGPYDFYLLWFDALKLKLAAWQFRPPPEPAHFRLAERLACFRPPPEPAHFTFRPPPEPAHPPYHPELAQYLREPAAAFLGRFRPPPEPAHWFIADACLTQEEQVVIVALDQVYPELRLVERISFARFGELMLNPQPLPP